MKTLLILSVLLSGLLAATAAAVGAAEAAPKEQPENVQVVEEEEVPAVEEPELIAPEEEASSPEARFFFCPSGWYKFRDGCFLYVPSTTTWHGAAVNCAARGASLASAHDLFDYTFLQEVTRRGGGSTAWMGGFYFQTWRWLDQSPFSYSNWHLVYSSTTHPCVYLNARAGWSNASCGGGRPFICAKKITSC